MLQEQADAYEVDVAREARGADRSLHIVLWSLWTLAVAGTAFYRWNLDTAANRPLDMLGLVIYSILTGLIGLLVITLIELRLDPDRFLD
jgi:hypothetical protein